MILNIEINSEQLQNTPAAYHGRPELSERLTAELREALNV